MVDYFALALTHGLLALAAWRLMQRPDLDRDPPPGDGEAAPAAPTGPAPRPPVRRMTVKR
jgi:hypothetical protein